MYTAIFCRPLLNTFQTAISTYYVIVKFFSVVIVRGDLLQFRTYYLKIMRNVQEEILQLNGQKGMG